MNFKEIFRKHAGQDASTASGFIKDFLKIQPRYPPIRPRGCRVGPEPEVGQSGVSAVFGYPAGSNGDICMRCGRQRARGPGEGQVQARPRPGRAARSPRTRSAGPAGVSLAAGGPVEAQRGRGGVGWLRVAPSQVSGRSATVSGSNSGAICQASPKGPPIGATRARRHRGALWTLRGCGAGAE